MSFPSALPEPTVPDPRTGPALRWGILGTGWIAQQFVGGLLKHTNHTVAAVGSRTQASAERFTSTYGGATAHGSYGALVADPTVDCVYVASPHPQHVEHALLAIEAGKNVLVEKPMAIDAAGAARIVDAARSAGVFAMEAMWTLCLPGSTIIRQLLDDGVLGRIELVTADLGEYFAPDHRIYDPALAGGAMMDLATYPMTWATWVLGAPTEVVAQSVPGPNGVVGQATVLMRHGEAQSVVHASALVETPTRASASGSDAFVFLDGLWIKPGGFTLGGRGGERLRHEEPEIGHEGLFWEALEVARCLGQGRTESPVRPLDATVVTLAAMDEVRRLTGDRLVGELATE